ncbi:sensory box/GGDEF family protein [Halorhodospira halochloris]|uniref:Sensory box/GGDEF family protein n=1 Tax=Halorhodospira halochloris TaxID=1052 RepID=A0A0X8X8Z3_HALHR|nr:NBR1-Ig-like domain-containing protein [Halorhodospira halochloris]MBK1651378.1 hypothetical protein [Halorhodospira halochloris]BAU57665.1 sensory box/GGDEF family protein [Halorhodospira halochloris]
MHSELECYIRRLARENGLSLAEVARRAGLSRQALYGIWQQGHYPSMGTILNLSRVLRVHPLSLLQQIFPASSTNPDSPSTQPSGTQLVQENDTQITDRSAFIRDETFPDGSQVLANSHCIKSWVLQNVGDQAWIDRYLVCQDNNTRLLAVTDDEDIEIATNIKPDSYYIPIPKTLPGETVTLSVGFTAPPTPATVISYWKMTFADGSLCFQQAKGIWIKVDVITPIKAASETRPTRPVEELSS